MELGGISFCQNDYPCASFAVFDDMRKRKQLHDVIIKVQNFSFPAHRVILAGGISYFRTLFVSSTEQLNEQEITLKDLDPKAVESLISFAYSGKIYISDEIVNSLILASLFLGTDQVYNACVEFLAARIQISTIVQVLAFAHDHGIAALTERCNIYIQKNFSEFTKSDDFLHLPLSCLKETISNDDLNVSSEKEVFQAVMKWVKSSSERHGQLPELLSVIRLVHLPIDYLIKEVASEELIQTSKLCVELLDDVKNYHLLPKLESELCVLKTKLRKAPVGSTSTVQKCDIIEQGLFAIYNHEKLGIVRYRDVARNKWREISVNQQNDPVLCVVAVNAKIYMFLERTVQIFDVRELKWEVLESSHNKIAVSAAVFRENIFYVFEDGSSRIYRFNVVSNQWMEPYRKKKSYRHSAACCLGKCIYVMGGCDCTYNCSSASVEINSSGDDWSEVSSMLNARAGHNCTTMNGKIYVCGGYTLKYDKDRKLVKLLQNSAEMCDPLTNQWKFISSMNNGRHSFSLVANTGKLFVVGGYGEDDTYATDVEVFSSVTKLWTYDFNVGLLCGGLKCVVSVPVAND